MSPPLPAVVRLALGAERPGRRTVAGVEPVHLPHGKLDLCGRGAIDLIAAEPRAHPFTAPAVRPETIRFCTRRKKITTGRAKIVEAAMSPP